MTDHQPPKTFFEKLERQVKMRPRWLFILEQVSVVAAIVLVAVGLVYFGSFISFLWRSAKFSSLPVFGASGYGILFNRFPWWHLLFVLVGIGAFIYLIRRHTHLYRWPLAVTLGVFILSFIAAAALTDVTGLHDRLANRSITGDSVPIVGSIYRGQGGIIRGLITPAEIIKIKGHTWTVDTGEETLKVKITDDTRQPASWDPAVGDYIVIVGERDDDTIEAIAIQPMSDLPDRSPFQMPPHQFYRVQPELF